MTLSVRPIRPSFVAEITGIDLRTHLPAGTISEIEQIIGEYGVLVFPDQRLSDEQQVAFSGRFGTLEPPPKFTNGRPRLTTREIVDVSNVDPDGYIFEEDDDRRAYRLANELWHTDGSFRTNIAKYSFLSARVVPPEPADTEFADMRAAYEGLSSDKRNELEGRLAEHSIWHSRSLLGGYKPTEEELQRRPPARHPLVRSTEASNRKALYIASHVSHIVDMPASRSRQLLDELTDFATKPDYVYAHSWKPVDLVIWDNRCTMHRATPYSDGMYVRDMRRTTCL